MAERIEAALTVIPPERLQVGPDCGMKYLSRDLAFAKLRALVEGARIVRERCADERQLGWIGRGSGRRRPARPLSHRQHLGAPSRQLPTAAVASGNLAARNARRKHQRSRSTANALVLEQERVEEQRSTVAVERSVQRARSATAAPRSRKPKCGR